MTMVIGCLSAGGTETEFMALSPGGLATIAGSFPSFTNRFFGTAPVGDHGGIGCELAFGSRLQ